MISGASALSYESAGKKSSSAFIGKIRSFAGGKVITAATDYTGCFPRVKQEDQHKRWRERRRKKHCVGEKIGEI